MNVARAVLDGLKQNEIDEADDRGLVGQPGHHGRVISDLKLADFLGNLGIRAQLFEEVGEALVFLGVVLFDGLGDLRRVSHDQLNVLLDDVAQLVDTAHIKGVRQGHLQRGIHQTHGQALIHPGHLGRHNPQQFGRQIPLPHRDDGGSQMTPDCLQDRVQVQDPEVLQDLADGLAGAFELTQHFLILQVVDQALVFDQREQRIGNVLGHRRL